MKLYELTNQYAQLLDMDIEPEVLQDTLESIEDEINDKAENMAKLVRNLEGDINTIKDEEKRLADRRKALENRVSNLKSYLQNQLEVAGISKVKSPTFTIYVQKNPASAVIENDDLVPSEYLVIQPPKVDKKAILKALKDGLVIEGCSIQQGQSLRIK